VTLPRGIRNNNPGNIRKSSTQWIGEVEGTDPSFCTFKTMAYGVRAITLILLTYTRSEGLNTIEAIINRWAPPVENNTSAYVSAVANACCVSPLALVTPLTSVMLTDMVEAITVHENGPGKYISASAFSLGVGNALGSVPLKNLG
jgi:hypothetical protein